MSTLEATTVQPRTIQVGIVTAAQTATYQLAPGLAQYVQAVYAEVTNAAATAVSPILTVSEQTGVVIAKKRQTGTIPAGQSGSGTWALRLDDNGGGGSGSGIQFDTDPQTGDWLLVTTTGTEPSTGFGLSFQDTHWIEIHGQNVVEVTADGSFSVTSPSEVFLTDLFLAQSNDIELLGSVTSGTGLWRTATITISAEHDELVLSAETDVDIGANNNVNITAVNQDIVLQLGHTSRAVIMKDHSGNSIFKVDENGDLHGKTGKSLVFDL